MKRISEIKQKQNNLVEIWECEYNELARTDILFKHIIDTETDIKPPLNPRNALTGGRTNATTLIYEGEADYIDFTSLYAYIQKYGKFPHGHQQIITENFNYFEN